MAIAYSKKKAGKTKKHEDWMPPHGVSKIKSVKEVRAAEARGRELNKYDPNKYDPPNPKKKGDRGSDIDFKGIDSPTRKKKYAKGGKVKCGIGGYYRGKKRMSKD